MNRVFFTLSIPLSLAFSACQTSGTADQSEAGLPASNPFSQASSLPFHAPAFDKIKDSDYKPALEAGIAEQQKEVAAIANNPEAPSFENTLEALEKTGQLLHRVNVVFDLMSGANTNDSLQALQEEMASKLAANQDEIFLNAKLFQRIETVYNQRQSLQLDAESLRLLEYQYQQFVLAGAKLSAADVEKMKKLNGEEATLSAKFTNQLLNAAKAGAVVFDSASQLDGASEADLGVFSNGAKERDLNGKYLVSLQNTTQQPPLQYLNNRDARKKLFDASWTRAEKGDSNDTRSVIIRLAEIRAEKAQLLGFENFAQWKLKDQMAETPAAVDQFFTRLAPSATAKAKLEAAEIQAAIKASGQNFNLEPWDWNHYAEQVRKAKYNLNNDEVKPYFELNKVLQDGVFYAANLLYGLTFKERNDLPVYQEDVRVFEVFDKDSNSLALFYTDYFKRDNKSGGAWMSNLVDQSFLMQTKPVIYNVCNFTKPAAGQPALLSLDDVKTMFHEMGHALHGMFAHQKYPTLSGTAVARDFVEFPSQFNENWRYYPEVLKHYAVHYKTGEPIPQTLLDKINKAGSFNAGYDLLEAIEASALDMQWHQLKAGTAVPDVDAFEKQALEKTGLYLAQVPPRYRSSYFLHIWSNGYAAGYYAYQWTKMLSLDAYAWFGENGGLTRENGQRFRDMVLSKGNTENYNKMFSDFRGHAPDIQPYVNTLGLPAK